MFVQIIKAKVTDREGLRRQEQVWQDELAAGADGWLGATGGVTDDGELVQVVRFESEEAARRNSERPEQGQWWEATSQHLENPTFTDSGDVETFRAGGSDDAGFVQVIEATISDRARMEEIMGKFEEITAGGRPDLIGGLTIWDGNRAITVAYFTSEEAARKGEAEEVPEEAKALDDEWRSLMSDVRFYDLKEPNLWAP